MSNEYNYYADKNELIKPIDQLAKNAERLKKVNYILALLEVLKNCFEHGNRIIKINFYKDRIVFFNNMKPEELQKMDFLLLTKKLLSFTNEEGHNREANFHEGLTCLLIFLFTIRTATFFYKSRQSEDGFFQYIEDASHYIKRNPDGTKVAVKQKDSELVDGWEVTIYLTKEKIDEIKPLIMETLKFFYFKPESKYSIMINDKEYEYHQHKNWTDLFSDHDSENGTYYYNFDFKQDGDVKVYWMLNNKEIVQYVPDLRQLSDLGVKGTVVLTNINQFANENRIELANCVFRDIKRHVDSVVQDNLKDEQTKNEVRVRYTYYKDKYVEFLNKVFDIPKYKLYESLWDKEDKEECLIDNTNFIYTLQELFGKNKIYKEQLKCDKFTDPKDRTGQMLTEDYFTEILEKMGMTWSKLRDKYPHIYLGLTVLNGEIDGSFNIVDLDKFITDDNKLKIIDKDNIEQHQLGNFDNSYPLLYPTEENFEYYVNDLELVKIDSSDDYREEKASFREVDRLKQFAVKKNKKPTEKPSAEYPKPIPPTQGSGSIFGSDNKPRNFNFDWSGRSFYLGIVNYARGGQIGQIPYLFTSEDDRTRSDAGGHVITKFTFPKYKALQKSVELLIINHNAFPDREVYPVIYNDEDDRAYAFYVKELGILAVNTAKLEGEDKQSFVNEIILTVSHELSHEFVPNHGKKFTQCYDEFLRISYILKDKESDERIPSIITKEL